MYPVKLGYEEAERRIKALLKNGHSAEAYVTSVFTAEKTLRRTLRQLVVSAGFISKYADRIVSNLNGIEAIKKAWELYDPKHERLTSVLDSSDWQIIAESAKERNELVHGVRVYSLDHCAARTKAVLKALGNIRKCMKARYGYDGWRRGTVRKVSMLHKDTRVSTVP